MKLLLGAGRRTTQSVSGTNNAHVAGTMIWTNTATSEFGTFDVSNTWETAGITLAYGEDIITVSSK